MSGSYGDDSRGAPPSSGGAVAISPHDDDRVYERRPNLPGNVAAGVAAERVSFFFFLFFFFL